MALLSFGTWCNGAGFPDVPANCGQDFADFDCAAYSESISDLPLLQVVKRATAVNPDEQLHVQALHRSWRILPLQH